MLCRIPSSERRRRFFYCQKLKKYFAIQILYIVICRRQLIKQVSALPCSQRPTQTPSHLPPFLSIKEKVYDSSRKMSDYLTHDLLIEILARACAESLVRCTSVCKLWNSIIRSPAFIKTHLNQQKNRSYLVVRNCPKGSPNELYSWYSDDVTFTLCGQQTPINAARRLQYQIVGSCNGILCLVDRAASAKDISLWNPAIRKWFKLPPQPMLSALMYWMYNKHEIGFGFDVTSGDYKVIRFHSTLPPRVFIYSLNSVNYWKDISHLAKGLEYLIFKGENRTFFNGAIHWVAYEHRTDLHTVLAFHLSNEVFRHIELPNGVKDCKLLVIEGRLTVVQKDPLTSTYCIWRMEEYGVVSSWIQYLYFDYGKTPDRFRFLGIRNKHELLLDVDRKLCAYDPHAKKEDAANQPKKLGIRSSNYRSLHVEPFVESLVLFGRQSNGNDDMVALSSIDTE